MKYIQINYSHENMNSAFLLDDYKSILNKMKDDGYLLVSTIPQFTLPSGKVLRADLVFEEGKANNVRFEVVEAKKVVINNREIDKDEYQKIIQNQINQGYRFSCYIPLVYLPNGQISKLVFVFYICKCYFSILCSSD